MNSNSIALSSRQFNIGYTREGFWTVAETGSLSDAIKAAQAWLQTERGQYIGKVEIVSRPLPAQYENVPASLEFLLMQRLHKTVAEVTATEVKMI